MTATVGQQNAPYPIGHALLTSPCAGRVVLVFDDIDGRTVDRPAELGCLGTDIERGTTGYWPNPPATTSMGTMDPYVVLVAPDHVPDEFGGSYEDVCQELGLDPIPGGYVLYLLDSVNGRATVISTNTRATREAVRDHPATGDGYWVTDPPTVAAVAASDGLVDVVAGWPEELGGGIRCVFCRELDPEWVYEGAERPRPPRRTSEQRPSP